MKYLFIISLAVFLLDRNLMAQSDTSMIKSDSAIFVPFEPISKNAERMPSFPGGHEEMYKFIAQHITYPVEARRNKISGTVVVQFVVSSEGELQKIKVARGLGYGCDEEAVRVVELMNEGHRWMPGIHNGNPVPVTFTLPIKFFLG